MRRATASRVRARCGVLLIAAVFLLQLPTARAQEAAAKEAYSGSEACGLCHSEQFEQFKKTYMYSELAAKYPPEQQGCEACHGPGAAHVAAEAEASDNAASQAAARLIYSFARHSASENAARCLGCHRKNENERLFGRSLHQAAGVFCADCHTAHLTATPNPALKPSRPIGALFSVPSRDAEREWLDNRLLRQDQPKLCYGCHKDIEAQFQLPVRHRVNEGAVKCTGCHNPHGSISENQLRAGNTDTCTACHLEKRGPYVFEHSVNRGDGCTACHTPHGSINVNLLKRRQQRQLCLECHVSPEATQVPHARLGFQAAGECTRCHVDIHGSNHQQEFLR